MARKGLQQIPDAVLDGPFVIGIDPGLKGGIVTLNCNGDIVLMAPLKTLELSSKKLHYDPGWIYGYLGDDLWDYICINNTNSNVDITVGIEQMQAMPSKIKGGTGNYTTGYGYGLYIGVLASLSYKYLEISPRTWQAEMLAGVTGEDTKTKAAKVATALFPSVDFVVGEKSRKLHDGLVDAALIARYTWANKIRNKRR